MNEKQARKRWLSAFLALRVGLEPTTSRLTAVRSTCWAIREYIGVAGWIRTSESPSSQCLNPLGYCNKISQVRFELTYICCQGALVLLAYCDRRSAGHEWTLPRVYYANCNRLKFTVMAVGADNGSRTRDICLGSKYFTVKLRLQKGAGR